MATNKRKDAAALFELIDKSTLKVPKNAGALRIPNWWSSKTNPPVASQKTQEAESTNGHSASAPAALRQPAQPSDAPTTAAKSATATPQPKLFQPPPAHVPPASSPSIRPPNSSIPVPVSPSVRAPAPAKADAPAAAPPPKPLPPLPAKEPAEENAAPRAAAATPKVFAPQTHAQDRKPWSPPRPGAFARIPGWVLLSGLAGIIFVVCCIVWLANHRNTAIAHPQGSGTSDIAGSPNGTGNPVQGPLIPYPGSHLPGHRVDQGPPPMVGSDIPPGPVAGRTGQVYQPGTVPYSADQYYIIICSTPSEKVARDDADFLASKGVDIAIERDDSRGKRWYVLIYARGFPSNIAAVETRNRIVQLGNQLSKNAWNDARIANGLSNPNAPAPAGGRPR